MAEAMERGPSLLKQRIGMTALLAGTAHALAWGVGIWMAVGPFYQGVSVTPTTSEETAGEAATVTATLVEANGLWVIWLLLVPVLLSGIALLAIGITDAGQTRRKALLWMTALVLLAFCAVGIFSIGLFYLPVVLALLCAAIANSLANPLARNN